MTSAALSLHPRLTPIYSWFRTNLINVSHGGRTETSQDTLSRLARQRHKVESLIAMADLGVTGTRMVRPKTAEARIAMMRKALEDHIEPDRPDREQEIERLLKEYVQDQQTLQLVHKAMEGGRALPYEEESMGTRTWLALVIHTLEALETGGSLIVDELDSSLHPLLMAEVLRLFDDSRSNPRNAQLIFSTHDTSTLGPMTGNHPLSRGQIWFVDKSRLGESHLTPLTDYRPRKGENIERGYMQGRYGGTPTLESDRMIRAAGGK